MDVTCERCRTEYEFDDALVSGRGTTVKCTNCGYQFKVRRGEGAAPERWTVRTVDGRELEFKALRELQAAINQVKVTRDDVLSREGSRPRRLGSIAELEPFFTNVIPSTAPGLGALPAQRMGIAVPPRTEGSVAIPLPASPTKAYGSGLPVIGAQEEVSSRRRDRVATLPGVIVAPGDAPPLPPGFQRTEVDPNGRTAPSLGVAPPPPAAPAPVPGPARAAQHDLLDALPDSETLIQRKTPPIGFPGRPSDGTPGPGSASEPPTVPRLPIASEPPAAMGRRSFEGSLTPTPSDVRASYGHEESYADPRFSSVRSSRRAGAARWIVGVVVLGVLVFVGVAVWRRQVASGARAPVASASDERITGFVQGGEKALAGGDVAGARELFAKASALAENDPRVLSALARIAIVEADVFWLQLRLSQEPDPDIAVIKKRFDPALERATGAVQRAGAAKPDDVAVTRFRIDALRLAGDRAGARALVDRVKATNAQPETQLVLAALELSEEKPEWGTVIDRLRAAVVDEQDLGRARALLIYALARSGNVTAARAEHDRLSEFKRPHPLTAPLRAFIARLEKGDGSIDVAALPDNRPDKVDRPASVDHPDKAPPAGDASPKKAAGQGAPPHGAGKAEDKGPAAPNGRVSDDYVAPNAGHIDTSDLPGQRPAAPPSTPATPAAPPAPAPPETKQ